MNLISKNRYRLQNLSLQQIKSSKKVVVSEFGYNSITVVEEEFKPKSLQKGQFLAKVHYAPINPLDLNRISGKIKNITLPFTPGSECSGTIIQTLDQPELIGQNVSFYVTDGSFREYAVGNMSQTIIIPKSIDLQHASSGFVNPITCSAMLDITQTNGAKAIINTAANSQVGQMISRYFTKNGIQVINLVRGQLLKADYGPFALDILDNNFNHDLQKLAAKLQATICFDCYSGSLTTQIMRAMPNHSTCYNYGSLIQENIENLSSIDLRWTDQTLKGFTASAWLKKQEEVKIIQIKKNIIDNFSTIFSSQIRTTFPIENINEALTLYRENMGLGKILLKL